MSAGRAEAREANPGPRSSALPSTATATDRTSDDRHGEAVQGAVVVLVDPAGVAEQILEKRGPSYSAELALELLAPLRVLRAVVR